MKRQRIPIAIGIAAVALAALGVAARVGLIPTITPRRPDADRVSSPDILQLTGRLPTALNENSGVAVSRRHTGILWSHNDSGNQPIVYATTLQGEIVGTAALTGARPRDWEDIALGPCPGEAPDGRTCLFVADTGDNNGRRRSVSLYIAPEPDSIVPEGTISPDSVIRIQLHYQDGRPDVEAMAVTPEGDVWLVTKGRRGPIRLYRVPHDHLAEEEMTLTAAGPLQLAQMITIGRGVTGAAISPSGRRFVVRTYTQLYFYRRLADGGLTHDGGPCFLGAIEPQGEGVDFLDDQAVVLTSEALAGRAGTIYRARCP